MKETIQIVKNFTPQQWLNVLFAAILCFGYNSYRSEIETLKNDVKIAREGRAKLFELYNNCVTNKTNK